MSTVPTKRVPLRFKRCRLVRAAVAGRHTRSGKCDHHRRRGRGCRGGRTCQDQRPAGAHRPLMETQVSLVVLQLNLQQSEAQSLLSFFFRDTRARVPPRIHHFPGGYCPGSYRSEFVRTLVRRMAGSTSWRGRPLTLIRPFPVFAWATACIVTTKVSTYSSFRGDRRISSRSLSRWASNRGERTVAFFFLPKH